MYVCHTFLIRSSADGHLGRFRFLGPVALGSFRFLGPVALGRFRFLGPVALGSFRCLGPVDLGRFRCLGLVGSAAVNAGVRASSSVFSGGAPRAVWYFCL